MARNLYLMSLGLLSVLLAPACFLLVSTIAVAQTDTVNPENGIANKTLETLVSFVKLRNDLLQDISAINQQIDSARSEAEKSRLRQQLTQVQADLRSTTRNLEDVAAGIDISSLRSEAQDEFNLQKELFALLKPALDEMKEMTSHVRLKSDLREKIAYYSERLPLLEQALTNNELLQQKSSDELLIASLKDTAETWRKQQAFMQSELGAAQLQLDKLEASETSLAEASQNYLKSFFQKRGLYLIEALLVVAAVFLLSRLSHTAMQRHVPGFQSKHRSFRTRLLELTHRILTVLLIILGPMLVFYLVEDWVLFSLGILILLGIGLTLRHALPRYLHQIQLFLNIGSVREGERITLEGLPWQVRQINVYCTLVNPVAGISQRVPIDEMVDLKSRPANPNEPWFPCKKDDWVILSDGVRGKVTGISQELVELIERGGAHRTYQTPDFLALSPLNLTTNFRLKETIGISSNLQRESTGNIPEILHRYIQQRAEEEGYGEKLLNLRVEFAQAGNSSLDLAIIADFEGELGDLYNRLRRAIQRWCVDACTANDWEIPFPQMTLHGELVGLERQQL